MTYDYPFARPEVGAEEAWAARKAIAARELTAGPCLEEAQRRLASLWGIRPGRIVLTSSGTAALWLAYRASSVHLLAVPALTFPATVNATPVEPSIYDCGLDTVHTCVSVSLWGKRPRQADVVVADYCQAIGSLFPESCATCYSFNSSKPITSSGGGCVVFPDVHSASHATARFSPRNLGGGSWAMTNVQAAILCVQLTKLDKILDARDEAIGEYARHLPIDKAYNVAVVSAPGRAGDIVFRLADSGVEAKQPWVLGGPNAYPLANQARESLLALPTWVSKGQAAEIARLALKAAKLEGVRL